MTSKSLGLLGRRGVGTRVQGREAVGLPGCGSGRPFSGGSLEVQVGAGPGLEGYGAGSWTRVGEDRARAGGMGEAGSWGRGADPMHPQGISITGKGGIGG